MGKAKIGVVHGRFKPLHNGHFYDYLLPVKKECEHLIIGICNPESSLTTYHATNPHRSESAANPLLQDIGFNTELYKEMTTDQKETSGTEIRTLMRENKNWEHLVPPAVYRYIQENNLVSRLK